MRFLKRCSAECYDNQGAAPVSYTHLEDPSMNDYHVPFPKDVYAMNVNSLMDVMVCREVLDNLMEACEVLGLDEPDLPKWKALR